MPEVIQPIDVEEIMKEIRLEIQEKGLNESMLSFQDVDGGEILKGLRNGEKYDPGEFERLVQQVNLRSNVPWYHRVEGNALANFIKKVIRKLIRFMIIPVVEEQNAFNGSAAQCLNQLLAYVKEQDQKITALERELQALREKED